MEKLMKDEQSKSIKLQPKSNNELIEHLIQDHGLKVCDCKKAIEQLERIGYSRLCEYGIGLRQKNNPEMFLPTVSFETLFALFEFDNKLRMLMFYVIEQVEIELRARIAGHMAAKYSPFCYLDKSVFDDKNTGSEKSVHDLTFASFQKEIQRQSKNSVFQQRLQHYGGALPIWEALDFFTFGNLSSFFSILKNEDKKPIALYYKTDPHYLKSWILSFLEVRNLCAHSCRLYNKPLKQSPRLYEEYKQFNSGKTTKVFPVILALKRFMLHRPEDWSYFLGQLTALMDCYQEQIQLSFLGFPINWKSILES